MLIPPGLGWLLLLLLLIVSASRESETKAQGTALKLKTEVVTVNVSVTTKDGQPVTGLERRHFEVYENGVRQSVEYFSDEDTPLSIGIIFDLSASMRGKMERALEALKMLIQASHRDDDYFIAGFNDQVKLLAEFSDGDALLDRVGNPQPEGNTALYDAVILGLEKVRQGRHRKRALVIISDGRDNASRYDLGELRQRLKEAGIQLYAVCVFCWFSGDMALWDMARVTGGAVFPAGSFTELEEGISRIALELRRQYSLGYTPSDARHDGRWRKIKVRVQPDQISTRLVVRAREGYFAAP